MRPRNIRTSLAVSYELTVLNSDGSVARRLPVKRNLLLDQGLNNFASTAVADLFLYAAVGTGTNPVKRDSGTIQFTRSGSTVTADAGFFEAGDVGRLLKFDSGEEMYITAFTDSQTVTVGASGALSASEGTVWYVNRTGLQTESKRTGSYSSAVGANGTTWTGSQFDLWRTYLFAAESGSVVYNEIGWSHSASVAANLNGMDLISGGVSLAAGQQLSAKVTWHVTLSPLTTVPYSNVITGWTQDGDCNIESVFDAVSGVSSAGATTNTGNGTNALEPSSFSSAYNKAYLSSSSAALTSPAVNSNLGVAGELGESTLSPDNYTPGSFTRTKSASWSVSQGNGSVRSIGIRFQSNRKFRILLDAAETKDTDHSLSLVFRWTWGRVLVN